MSTTSSSGETIEITDDNFVSKLYTCKLRNMFIIKVHKLLKLENIALISPRKNVESVELLH